MRITNPLLTKALGLFGASVIRGWTSTLDYRIVYNDPTVDPLHPRCRPSALYVLWHEYLICPLGVRGRNMTVLISQHRDGELITRVLRHLGFNVVRGSSTRGGIAAVKQLLNANRRNGRQVSSRVVSGEWCGRGPRPLLTTLPLTTHHPATPPPLHLIITPDGPRGPRRQLEAGAIFLASRLGMPIVCMGFAFDRPWRLSSWDNFAIPRPYSRARAVISPYLEIPQDLHRKEEGGGMKDEGGRMKDEKHSTPVHPSDFRSLARLRKSDSLEHYRIRVEECLNQVTLEAEQWAEAGTRYMGRTGNPIYELPFLRNEHLPVKRIQRPPPLDRLYQP